MNKTLSITLAGLLSIGALGCNKAASEEGPIVKRPPPAVAEAPAALDKAAPSAPAPTAAAPAAEPQAPSAAPAAAPSPASAEAGACAFQQPQFFADKPTKWEGACQNGKAHGKGVLRAYEGKKVVEIFYGTMENGEPKLGVVEARDGMIIGRFEAGGKPIDSDEFKDRLDGVNEAVAAAKEVSDSYQRAGNSGSATYYAKKAKMLGEQIE